MAGPGVAPAKGGNTDNVFGDVVGIGVVPPSSVPLGSDLVIDGSSDDAGSFAAGANSTGAPSGISGDAVDSSICAFDWTPPGAGYVADVQATYLHAVGDTTVVAGCVSVFFVVVDTLSQDMSDSYPQEVAGDYRVLILETADGEEFGFPHYLSDGNAEAHTLAIAGLQALTGVPLSAASVSHCSNSCWVLRYFGASQFDNCVYVIWMPSLRALTNDDFLGTASGSWYTVSNLVLQCNRLDQVLFTEWTLRFFQQLNGALLIRKRASCGEVEGSRHVLNETESDDDDRDQLSQQLGNMATGDGDNDAPYAYGPLGQQLDDRVYGPPTYAEFYNLDLYHEMFVVRACDELYTDYPYDPATVTAGVFINRWLRQQLCARPGRAIRRWRRHANDWLRLGAAELASDSPRVAHPESLKVFKNGVAVPPTTPVTTTTTADSVAANAVPVVPVADAPLPPPPPLPPPLPPPPPLPRAPLAGENSNADPDPANAGRQLCGCGTEDATLLCAQARRHGARCGDNGVRCALNDSYAAQTGKANAYMDDAALMVRSKPCTRKGCSNVLTPPTSTTKSNVVWYCLYPYCSKECGEADNVAGAGSTPAFDILVTADTLPPEMPHRAVPAEELMATSYFYPHSHRYANRFGVGSGRLLPSTDPEDERYTPDVTPSAVLVAAAAKPIQTLALAMVPFTPSRSQRGFISCDMESRGQPPPRNPGHGVFLVVSGDASLLRMPLRLAGFVQEEFPDTTSEGDQCNYVAQQWSTPFDRDLVSMLVSWQVGNIVITFSSDVREVMDS